MSDRSKFYSAPSRDGTPLPPDDPETERLLKSRLKPEDDDPQWMQVRKGKHSRKT